MDVLRQRLSAEIDQGEIIGRLGLAELGGGGHQLDRLALVDGAAAAGNAQHGEREHGLAVAGVGGALVPLLRLGVVAPDAHRVGIELAQHGHRLGIARLRAGGGEIERGLVLAALIGAEHQIDIGIVGRGRRDHGRSGRRARRGRWFWRGILLLGDGVRLGLRLFLGLVLGFFLGGGGVRRCGRRGDLELRGRGRRQQQRGQDGDARELHVGR